MVCPGVVWCSVVWYVCIVSFKAEQTWSHKLGLSPLQKRNRRGANFYNFFNTTLELVKYSIEKSRLNQ